MLTGSVVSAIYGTPRSTQDVDLVVAGTPDQIRQFVRSLPQTDYYVDLDAALDAMHRESQFNIVDHATGWKVDLIARKSRAFSREEFDRRTTIDLHGVRVSAATAEDVLIAKLEWAKLGQSERQLEDVAGILRVQSTLDRPYIERWVCELQLESQWKTAQSMAHETS